MNTGEATVPAGRKSSGAQHKHYNRTKQHDAYEDCEDHGLSGERADTQEKTHFLSHLDAV